MSNSSVFRLGFVPQPNRNLLGKLCETSQSLSKPPVMPKLDKNAKYA
ncbi:hypothetical protein NIES267_02360 [Calothrix parasitica NIES-267]|uniref:Uncharacterized protein n=1 Tax=Calothrix parasitica NIES-267 TaxID=1973488 RepID=A0A1Z4LHR7_9CYAN|nr:hypothetical protein NIES267_02360 [Calothrix parasitica NIES-267]